MHIKSHLRRPRRSGVALVYVVVAMTAMMGLCSLAVDLGRYEVVHQELYSAACAAARAAAAQIQNGTATTVTSAATTVATSNRVDGQLISSGSVTVTFLKWVSASNNSVVTTGNFSAANVNAVRVTITYSCPLAFARVLGLTTKTAVEHSTAEVVVNIATPKVYATGDIWLANEPTGTTASQADPSYAGLRVNQDHEYPYDIAGPPGTFVGGASGYTVNQAYSSPIKVGFNVQPGATITITNCSGSTSYDYDTAAYLDATANGGTTWVCHDYAANNVSEHGISDATMPIGSMNAVFTGSGVPDNIATVPPCLDFSTQAERDYVGLQPKLQQAFYVGNGQTSGNVPQQQQIVVPANSTYLFLGVMDAWEWDNNNGFINCTVTQTYITTVE